MGILKSDLLGVTMAVNTSSRQSALQSAWQEMVIP